MSQSNVKLNYAGFDAYRTSGEVQSFLMDLASDIAARAGDGYGTDSKVLSGRTSRVVASVYTDTFAAKKDQSDNNTLLKAVSG